MPRPQMTTLGANPVNRGQRRNMLRRVGQQNIRELWAALALIREAVEDCAPPGSVANPEYLLPDPGYEAEALVQGIYAIAARRR